MSNPKSEADKPSRPRKDFNPLGTKRVLVLGSPATSAPRFSSLGMVRRPRCSDATCRLCSAIWRRCSEFALRIGSTALLISLRANRVISLLITELRLGIGGAKRLGPPASTPARSEPKRSGCFRPGADITSRLTRLRQRCEAASNWTNWWPYCARVSSASNLGTASSSNGSQRALTRTCAEAAGRLWRSLIAVSEQKLDDLGGSSYDQQRLPAATDCLSRIESPGTERPPAPDPLPSAAAR